MLDATVEVGGRRHPQSRRPRASDRTHNRKGEPVVVVPHPRTGAPRQLVRHRHITLDQARELDDAWRFAVRQGWALNTLVTINWVCAPPKIEDAHPMDRNARFRDGLKTAMARITSDAGIKRPFVWIEVREKTRTHGEHVHLALHVPADAGGQISGNIESLVQRLVAHQSLIRFGGEVNVKPIKWWPGMRDYLLKGGDDEVLAAFPGAAAKRRAKGSQGVIEGPRVRIAHAIGPTARREAEAAFLADTVPLSATSLGRALSETDHD